MTEENKESRVNIEDLAQAEQELTPEEAQKVQGGTGFKVMPYGSFQGGVRVATGDINNDGFDDIIVGVEPGGNAHVK